MSTILHSTHVHHLPQLIILWHSHHFLPPYPPISTIYHHSPLHPLSQFATICHLLQFSPISICHQSHYYSCFPVACAFVVGHGGGRKLSCIDRINTTIYYKNKFPRWLTQPHSTSYISNVDEMFLAEIPATESPGPVAGHGGGRKLRCIDGINTTIYYTKKFPRWLTQPHSSLPPCVS